MPAQTHISKLTLTNFRNYATLTIDLAPGAVVFSGDNGAGKTNLLEAISLLTPGRGLRRAPYADVAREGGDGGFALHARLDGPDGQIEIGTGISIGEGEGGRRVRINGATARSAEDMLEWLRVVWLTPAMDALFTGPAADRRRFLDRLVLAIDPAHAIHASRYEAAMRARNKLLREDERPDPAWLAALEARMAEHGPAMAAARADVVGALNDHISGQADGPFARAHLAIEGWSEADAEPFAADLRQSRPRDAAAGRTLAGPHRQDLVVTHIAKQQPAARASTGEQKALLVGIVLAHADLVAARSGRRPILLMDEVAAHLDPLRRAVLFDRLEASGGQIWLTGTEPALFDGLGHDATWLRVRAGVIEGSS